jgi:hypothetical protein
MNSLSKLRYYHRFWPLIMAISILFLSSCTSRPDSKLTNTPTSYPIMGSNGTNVENDPKAKAQDEMMQGKEKARIIIDALSKYKNEKGKYPDTLEELVPDYLKKIPQTDTNQKYQYLQHLQGIYELWFLVENKRGVSCSYSNRFEDWECGLTAEP